jgi:hypothetical protein
MRTEQKIDLVFVAIIMTLMYLMVSYDPTPVPDEVMEEVESAIDNPIQPTSLVPFDWENPDAEQGFGLTIGAGDPCSLNLEEITCADVAAVVKYRKAIAAIKTRILKEKVDRLEREVRWHACGIHVACTWNA